MSASTAAACAKSGPRMQPECSRQTSPPRSGHSLRSAGNIGYDIAKEQYTLPGESVRDDLMVTFRCNVPIWRSKVDASVREAQRMEESATHDKRKAAIALETAVPRRVIRLGRRHAPLWPVQGHLDAQGCAVVSGSADRLRHRHGRGFSGLAGRRAYATGVQARTSGARPANGTSPVRRSRCSWAARGRPRRSRGSSRGQYSRSSVSRVQCT